MASTAACHSDGVLGLKLCEIIRSTSRLPNIKDIILGYLPSNIKRKITASFSDRIPSFHCRPKKRVIDIPQACVSMLVYGYIISIRHFMASVHQTNFARVRVDSAGRIVIPAELRERYGIEPGQEVILSEEPEGLCLQTFRQAFARAQSYFATYGREGVSIVDELIRDRRDEAAREDRE